MVFKNLSTISVIVTTKNEEKNIGNCLESIKHQTYLQDKIEIIVVDNNSTDKTKEIARRYTNKVYNYPSLGNIENIRNFRGAQLNFGVFRKSRGEIIFFPDADMTFDEKLIEESVEFIQKMGVDALYIPEVVLGKGLFGRIRNFERSFYNQTCIDAIRVVKRSLFVAGGGFDEKNISFGYDDWDFTKIVKKLTNKIGIISPRIYHHEEDMTIKKYLSKKRKYTETSEGYIKKWDKDDLDVKRQFGFWYRYFRVFIEDGKWKKLLRCPILTGGMYFLRLTVGIFYLYQKFFKK